MDDQQKKLEEQQQAEQQAAQATEALARGDLYNASMLIADALTHEPMNQEWLGVLGQVYGATQDPLSLVPVGAGQINFATGAARAYFFMLQGNWAECLNLLMQVVLIRPDVPYLEWAGQWFGVDLARSIPADALLATVNSPVVRLVEGMASPMPEDDPRRRTVAAAARLMATLTEAHPNQALFFFAGSLVARRLGATEEAIKLAQEAVKLEPGWHSCVGLACAQRDAGNVDAAVACFREAKTYEPEDVSPLLDAADCLLDAERFDDALATYEEVLEAQPDHPWAAASVLYARHKKDGNAEDRTELLMRREGQDHRAADLADRLDPPEAYVNFLPGPGDDTAKAAMAVLDAVRGNPDADGGAAKLTVTHPEAPSVIAAFELAIKLMGKNIGWELEVEKVQQPDPRVPKAQVDFALWVYDDNTPRRNTGGPADGRASEPVTRIAAKPFHPEFWDPMAKEIGERMGSGWLNALLCVMVDPPPPPDDSWHPMIWVQRVQIATALVISHMDDGWADSARRRALFSLAMGPVDWTVDAALIALAWRVREDPSIREDVAGLFRWLESQVPKDGFTCFEYPLVCCWLALGGHDDATRERLEQWRERVETESGKNVAWKPADAIDGLTLERYAEFCVRRDELLGGMTAGDAVAAAVGGGSGDALKALCGEYGIRLEQQDGPPGPAAARIPRWDQIVNANIRAQRAFEEFKSAARLRSQGIDPHSAEGQVAQNIQAGRMDMHQEMAKAESAARQLAEGEGGDPDPVVFPGQPLERLSQYVDMMKIMQTGDMNGALGKYGLDMGTYGAVAQAWGVKLAADPTLNAKFSQMMQG